MANLSSEHVISQSQTALRQWGAQWTEHCIQHKVSHPDIIAADLSHWENIGVGKALLLIANGASFETELKTIQKYRRNVDIMVCDKTLGAAIEHGIVPDYCLVADANVSYEKYMEPWKDLLQDTVLFQNVCGNPKWMAHGNWEDRRFYVNVDAIQSEEKWIALTGCQNRIAAGTNVSNAMVIFATQCTNQGRRNFMGYDKILLIGFDYSWRPEGNYYAFNKDAGGKHQYMRHQYIRDLAGQFCYSSNNLIFSAKWLAQYIHNFRLPVVQCGKSSILHGEKLADLSEQMQYSFKTEDRWTVQELVKDRKGLTAKLKEIDKQLRGISEDHRFAVAGSY